MNTEIAFDHLPSRYLPTGTSSDQYLSAVLLDDKSVLVVWSDHNADDSILMMGYAASERDLLYGASSVTGATALFTPTVGANEFQRVTGCVQRLPENGSGDRLIGLVVQVISGGFSTWPSAPTAGAGVDAWPITANPGYDVHATNNVSGTQLYVTEDDGATWTVYGDMNSMAGYKNGDNNWRGPMSALYDSETDIEQSEATQPGVIVAFDTPYTVLYSNPLWACVTAGFFQYQGSHSACVPHPTIQFSDDYGVTWTTFEIEDDSDYLPLWSNDGYYSLRQDRCSRNLCVLKDENGDDAELLFRLGHSGVAGLRTVWYSLALTGGVATAVGCTNTSAWRQVLNLIVGTDNADLVRNGTAITDASNTRILQINSDGECWWSPIMYPTSEIDDVMGTYISDTWDAISLWEMVDDYGSGEVNSVICEGGDEYVWYCQGDQAYVRGIPRAKWNIGAAWL